MAIVFVHEIVKTRGADLDEKFKQDFSRAFIVGSSIVDESAEAIQYAIDPNDATRFIPVIGDSFGATVLEAFVTEVNTKQKEDAPCLWEVEVKYTSETDPGAENPLNTPLEIEWSNEDYQRPIENALIIDVRQDNATIASTILGREGPCANSAGDPFDPPPMRDDSRQRLTITKVLAKFPLANARSYRNTLNADTIWGFAPGKVRCRSISGSAFRHNVLGVLKYFWKTTYVFEIREEGWNFVIIDAGFRVLKNGKMVEVHDHHAQQHSSPIPLDGSGERNDPGPPAGGPALRVPVAPNPPVTLHFQVYNFNIFAALGLPTTVAGVTDQPPAP